MRYFLDTEFNEFGGELISFALIREDGLGLYQVLGCEKPGPWVAENVIPILYDCPVPRDLVDATRAEAAQNVAQFLVYDMDPVIVTDWPDDIRYFCELLITGPGQMVGLRGVKFDMQRVDAYPTQLAGAVQHNAWWDAMALRAKLAA